MSGVPFVDLGIQVKTVRAEFLTRIEEILDMSSFVAGSEVEQFENSWAAYLQCDSAVGVANGGDALEIGFRTLGIGPGDEVLVPANTFSATAQAVLMCGATPVAVDVGRDSSLLDPEAAMDATTARTRAVVAVNLFGERFDCPEFIDWCEQRDILYCEDAAQSHGSSVRGEKINRRAAFTAFSFYPGKNLGAFGDAGAVVFDSEEDTDIARSLRNYGSTQKYVHQRPGRNSRLDSIQAAVLSAKLPWLDLWNQERTEAARLYTERLADIAGERLQLPKLIVDGNHVWHLYVLEVSDREALSKDLSNQRIGWGLHYPRLITEIPGVRSSSCEHAKRKSERILSLPMFPGITESQIDVVCEAIRQHVRA